MTGISIPLFTAERPVIFAFHGYPGLIHKFTYNRTNHQNFHVHGFFEEGTTTTPFDMVAVNGLDRYHLALDAIDRVPKLSARGAHIKQELQYKLIEHRAYVREHGEDMTEIREWKWKGKDKSNKGAATGFRGEGEGKKKDDVKGKDGF